MINLGAAINPIPVARIVPGDATVVAATGIVAAVAGDVRRETLKDAGGPALAFGTGGTIRWESASLLESPRGSILLDFNYSSATEYNKDEPILAVTDANAQVVLRVTIGRVMFKAARPPHEFAIDLYLNEAEGSWMRTVVTWERLDAERMYLRVTVNDRVYDHAVVPAFPQGKLKFLVGPEKVNVREVAFYDRPLPRAAHPHIGRLPRLQKQNATAGQRGFIGQQEQNLLNERGGIVVFVPDGALTQALLCGLRTMGFTDLRGVNDAGLRDALKKAGVLVLPDNDFRPPNPERDRAITEYVRAGGGLLALGKSALEVRRIGLAAFEPREAGCEGSVIVQLDGEAAVWQGVSANSLFKGKASLEMFMRRGPLYQAPAISNAVAAVEPFTGLPCALAMPCDKGRVVLTALMPFGYYFWNPTFETVAGVSDNAARYLYFKGLLFYAAGVSLADVRDPGDALQPVRMNVSRNLGKTQDAPLNTDDVKKTGSARFDNLKLGPAGAIGFWFKGDTLNLAGPEPRNLVWLSDGGENTLQLYYDPCDQFLVLKGVTPNEESLIYANERTTWDGKAWRHIGFTWQATQTGAAAVELFIDGRPAASGGVPLPTAGWNRMIFGAAPGMQGLEMEAKEMAIGSEPRLDLAAIHARAVPPIAWEDTPEDRAQLERFQREHRVAILGDTHPNHWKSFRTYDQYGLKCDVLLQKDLEDGALEKMKYAVILALGGGPPAYPNPQAMRDRIRNYIRAGHGYVGICAGMIEAAASDSPTKTLGLYKTPIQNFLGTQLTDIQLPVRQKLRAESAFEPRSDHPVMAGVPAAFRDGSGAPVVRFVHMCGPPLRLKDPNSDTAAVARIGMAPEYGAAAGFGYGKGRGVVWAPHPELDGWGWWKPSDRTRYVMRKLLRNSVYYAASFPP